jgi:hypothetical protein
VYPPPHVWRERGLQDEEKVPLGVFFVSPVLTFLLVLYFFSLSKCSFILKNEKDNGFLYFVMALSENFKNKKEKKIWCP